MLTKPPQQESYTCSGSPVKILCVANSDVHLLFHSLQFLLAGVVTTSENVTSCEWSFYSVDHISPWEILVSITNVG